MVDISIDFRQEVKDFATILEKTEIQNDRDFLKWKDTFLPLYGLKGTNLELYVSYSMIFLASIEFILNYVISKEEKRDYETISLNCLSDLKDNLKKRLNFDLLSELVFYIPFLNYICMQEPKRFEKLIEKIESKIIQKDIDPIYKLDMTFQGILDYQVRHFSGEFFTPPFLVKKMVDYSYQFGDKVLDPCCGTGNFLLSIIRKIMNASTDTDEKIKALKKVYGFDLNPFSIYLTRLNMLCISESFFSVLNQNLFKHDFLLGNFMNLPQDFDLVIGNPPWYTLREIESIEMQNAIKELSEQLEIKPLPKNVLNIEIASLFFYQAKVNSLKADGRIAFVITEGVLNGSHAARFRTFKGFKDISVWTFSDQIKKIFNIGFICLFARKNNFNEILEKVEIPAYCFQLNNLEQKADYFSSVDLAESNRSILIPYSIEYRGKNAFFKKLIKKEQLSDLLPIERSIYKDEFHKGADLNPRTLIFIKCREINDELVEITPDERIIKRAKVPWNKLFFENEIVEKKYVYNVIKSTELVKFFCYDFYEVFLPLKRESLIYDHSNLKEKGLLFYNKINSIYLKHKKDTTRHASLMDNLDRWSKLINRRQLSDLKVVYNNSGSRVNSAVIQGSFLVTGDLSFFAANNPDEAYYLSSILNSDIVTEQIRIKKSSRHIFKLPFEMPIQKFDPGNQIHSKLAELSKKGESISRNTITSLLNHKKKSYSKIHIQNTLEPSLKPIMEEINKLTLTLLKR